MNEVRAAHSLPSSWPGQQRLQKLVSLSAGLFIWASTAIQILCYGYNPHQELKYLLEGGSGLDQLYAAALHVSGDWRQRNFVRNLRMILGAVAVGQIPMSDSTLDSLLGLDEETSSRFILSRLHSVLDWSGPGHPVRTMHASFVDYLTNRDRCGDRPWFIDPVFHHRDIAIHSLEVMRTGLRFNICNVETSHLSNAEIDSDRIQLLIPSHLQYACRFWIHHLTQVEIGPNVTQLVRLFMSEQLLFWLEALCLTGQLVMVSVSMLHLRKWVQGIDQNLTDIASEIVKFVKVFHAAMSRSIPHLYVSAVPLWPKNSHMYHLFGKRFKDTVRVPIGGVEYLQPLRTVIRAKGVYGGLHSVSFSPDGRYVASGMKEMVHIWDVETASAAVEPFAGHKDVVNSVAYSPNGLFIVSGSQDKTLLIWDAKTGVIISGPFDRHTGSINSVAFSPDSARVISGSDDGRVCLWDLNLGSLVTEPFAGHTDSVNSVAFSLDGSRIISGSDDGTVCIWSALTGSREVVFTKNTDRVSSVAFSPNGTHAASGLTDGTVLIWDIETGLAVTGPFQCESAVTSISILPSGRYIAGSGYNTIWIWDAETGSVVAGPFEVPRDSTIGSLAVSPDGTRIIYGSADNTLRPWDVEVPSTLPTSSSLTGLRDPVNSVAFPAQGRWIAFGGDHGLGVWHNQTGSRVFRVSGEWHVNGVAFSPDGRHLVTGSSDKTVQLWDVESGVVVAGPLKGHTNLVSSVAFSPDGSKIVSGSWDKTVRIWDSTINLTIAGPFTGHTDFVSSVAFSPDNKHIASGSYDTTVRIWSVETPSVASRVFEGHSGFVSSVAFSPDGTRVASGSWDSTIRIWDVEVAVVAVGPLEGHKKTVSSVAFSPDGTRLVSGSWDNTLRIWDVDSGTLVGGPFKGHADQVLAVAFAPDGRSVASGSYDGTVRIWDVDQEPLIKWTVQDDGWVVDSVGQLILWLPPYYPKERVLLPPASTLIGAEPIVLDCTQFAYGDRWRECFNVSS